MEGDVVVVIRPTFYKRYVDDTCNCRHKNTVDELYDGLSNYHAKVKLTIETIPLKFVDTEIIHNNDIIETWVHSKKTKLPTRWTSNIPRRYKRNTIKAELYQAKRISSNFTNEVALIRNQFQSAGSPMHFVNSALHEFTTAQTNEDKEFIIPPWFFEVKKKIVLVEIPYCLKNESSSKQFIKKFDKSTNDTFDMRIKWLTNKVKTLCRVKDKPLRQDCKVYKGICSCNESYVVETVRNVEVRWDEHNNPMEKSNPSKHIKDNVDHVFNWSVLANAKKTPISRKSYS